MDKFQDIIDAICREAGWRHQQLTEDNSVQLELEGGLSFELSQPAHGLALFKSCLADLPGDQGEADRFCRRLGQMSAASFKKRRSILSVKKAELYLHSMLDLRRVSLNELPGVCQSFLNDCDWWLKNIADGIVDSGAGNFPNFGVRL